MTPSLYDPYCGPAPLPTQIWSSWNLDPWLIGALAATAWLLLRLAPQPRNRAFSAGALAILVIAFVSPLCALTSALFSARAIHHILVLSVAAPLVVLALGTRLRHLPRPPAQLSFLAFAGMLWLWHLPAPYAFALSGHAAFWMMQGLLLASAVWIWRDMLDDQANSGQVVALSLGTMLQMGMLGALLTFARDPLFDAHFTTTMPYGLTPLADQQLAGVLMWVPAALPFLVPAFQRLKTLLSAEPVNGNGH